MVVSVAPGSRDAAQSRWQEWVIRGSLLLLLAIGVSAIWGRPIRDWLASLGGETDEASGAQTPPPSPAGGTL